MTSVKPIKRSHESNSPRTVPTANLVKNIESLPDIALAAVVSSKKQSEATDFINFLLCSLERNSEWLNKIVNKQNNFKCALLVGAGPNRFQLQEQIFPTGEDRIKFEVELRDSEDYDKIGIAALLKLTTPEINHLMEYIKTRLFENHMLQEDLTKGKSMGISFVVLRPLSEKQYRVMERIVIGSLTKCSNPAKKRRVDKSLIKPQYMKKARPIA